MASFILHTCSLSKVAAVDFPDWLLAPNLLPADLHAGKLYLMLRLLASVTNGVGKSFRFKN
ncbi:hypothetical protein [Allorhodopirellula heiligendammensis]|uniref:Uncharacterized protein n=1 Tax=Allorhodopirellula heiligendammensis TaxID=2714739 RepID=A0A5C6B0F5_9BACT|nr:hypothetical protein [Allorhodopirellula heiligendammensis]TWU05390.1 hypothetical protein Poly21_57070 [Allorhodopirellula heiligendammensis]